MCPRVVKMLRTHQFEAGIQQVFSGESLDCVSDPATDPRMRDIVIQPNLGRDLCGRKRWFLLKSTGLYRRDDTHVALSRFR